MDASGLNAGTTLSNGSSQPPDSATKLADHHPGGHIKHGGFRQSLRLCLVLSYFMFGVLTILTTQVIGSPLYFIDRKLYYKYMARTKEHFGILTTTITQWWSPTIIRITGDRSVRHQIRRTHDGRAECHFPDRLILIANHQLYSDWLYLWWVAYTARMHGYLYIILKDSLKWLPFLGLGMQFYGFIFLARKWETDEPRFKHRLSKLSKDKTSPMWLLIFPEGTNLSYNGRVTSKKYADKMGLTDPQHVLIPRSTGLRFSLQQLEDGVDYVYDCTVAYEGIPRGKYGQDIFTLRSSYLEGRPPKSVNFHWRRFPISQIPYKDAAAFDIWIRDRWTEKDGLLEYYLQNGHFPEDNGAEMNGYVKDEWKGPVETEVRLERYTEIVEIVLVIATIFLAWKVIHTLWAMVI